MADYGALAVAVLSLHLIWIGWVILGWTLAARRRALAWLHVGSLAYSIFIEIAPVPCPLTLAETYFERRAGITPYAQPFLVHYLEILIYPNVSPALLTVIAVLICVFILGVHLRRFRRQRRTGGGQPRDSS